jgi:apolipoprotein N-acyltransferase
MICWFAATVNWAWEQDFSWPGIRRGIITCGAMMVLVLLYGGARLAFATSAGSTVRIASLTAVDGRSEVSFSLIKKDREAFRQVTEEFHDRYFEETRRQADAGADLVLWPEMAGIVLGEDESDFIERASRLSREESIYLVVPFFTLHSEQGRPSENKLLAFDPTGEIVLEHYKYGGNILEGSVAGDGVLGTFQTPFATVSGVICWDMDFPRTISQAGRNGTDVLLAPALDWLGISTTHGQMAVFRAIENGVALVRQADNGLSIATDPYGQVLASMDHFATDKRLMVVEVPTERVPTLYSTVGDLFAWITIFGSLTIVLVTLVRGRTRQDG